MKVGGYTFELRDRLGQGSFGTVYKGHGKRKEDTVAIKQIQIPDGNAHGRKGCEAIKEIKSLEKVPSHPNIVKFIGCHFFENSFWIIIEYCDYGDLEKYLKKNKSIPMTTKVNFMQQIACAIAFLHSLVDPIVHRDLKPANIMIHCDPTYNGPVIKLTDFGLAKVAKGVNRFQLATICGTECFMAPEFFTQQTYDSSVDVFAMGLVFMVMLNQNHQLVPVPVRPRMNINFDTIGRMMMQRLTGYGQPVVCVEVTRSDDQATKCVKELILLMVVPKATHRIKATEVEKKLKSLNGHMLSPTPVPAGAARMPIAVASNNSVHHDNSVVVNKTKISVQKGDITKQQANILVNTIIGRRIDLDNGALSKAFLSAGGREQQQILVDFTNGASHDYGSVYETPATGDLAMYSTSIYHALCPPYNKQFGVQVIETILKECLHMAKNDQARSIAFPAIGCGGLRFPPESVATCMIQETMKFLKANPMIRLKNVYLVIFDLSTYTTFVDALNKIGGTSPGCEDAVHRDIANVERRHGRKAALKEMAKMEVTLPDYWTFSTQKLTKETFLLFDIHKGSSEFNDICALLNKTWRSDLIPGRNAANMVEQRHIYVKQIQRIENVTLYKKYVERKKMFLSMAGEDKMGPLHKCRSISISQIETKKVGAVELNKRLVDDINECYLFHGTSPDVIDHIMTFGLDTRLAPISQGVCGSGIYAAENSTKADQYAVKSGRTSDCKVMFLVRLMLGKAYVANRPPNTYRRPPCATCKQQACKIHHELFDSVIGGTGQLFREFIVYDSDQCYPEYIITYARM